MEKFVFILGSGGHANEIRSYIKDLASPESAIRDKRQFVKLPAKYESLLVDNNNPEAISVKDYQKLWKEHTDKGIGCYTIIGSGYCQVRGKMLVEIKGELFSLIHPTAKVISSKIGKGSLIAPGAVIAPNAVIHQHVLVNYNATVGHDTIIDSLSVIGPNSAIGGNVICQKGVYVGSGACVKEGITLGENSIIGMGAVVIKNVPPNTTVAGVPAKIIKGQ